MLYIKHVFPLFLQILFLTLPSPISGDGFSVEMHAATCVGFHVKCTLMLSYINKSRLGSFSL